MASSPSTHIMLTEDETDDLLYTARANEAVELRELLTTLHTTYTNKDEATSSPITLADILSAAVDSASGNTPAHYAAANNALDALQVIAEAVGSSSSTSTTAANPLDAPNHAGNTPLHYAALNGHLDAAKMLVEKGAVDVSRRNNAGHLAAFEAERAQKGDVDAVVTYLLAAAKEEKGGEDEEMIDAEGAEDSVPEVNGQEDGENEKNADP